jgi:hypothetical protein
MIDAIGSPRRRFDGFGETGWRTPTTIAANGFGIGQIAAQSETTTQPTIKMNVYVAAAEVVRSARRRPRLRR